jgi:hypothetical protein
VPQIDLHAEAAVPAELTHAELVRLLKAIEAGDEPHRDFAIGADLRDLHLPNPGVLSVPIYLQLRQQRVPSAAPIEFAFQAKEHDALFPSFAGAFAVESRGLAKSEVRLSGEYTPPLLAIGRVLDSTLLRNVATRSLNAFLEQLTRTAEENIRRREAEIAQSQRFAR